jgi:hypothetical protein
MSKAVIQPFEEYQKSRITFVQTVAELAKRKQNVDSLKRLGVMKLLGPLLSDPVTSIKQSAALAIGRLVKLDLELATSVVNDDRGKILSQLLESLESNNKFYKQAACFVISSIAKHNKDLAAKVVEGGSIKFLVSCLEEYDPSLKQYAAWAMKNIAENSLELAVEIERAKGINALIQCLQEPEIELKRVVIKTLAFIAKHSRQLASSVANVGDNLNNIIYYLQLKDTLLRRQILLCLGNIATNIDDAKRILDSIDINLLIECIQGKDVQCQKNALVLINEIVKNSQNLASTIMSKIKPSIFVKYIAENTGEERLCAIITVSTLASHFDDNALNIINNEGHIALAQALFTETDFKVLAAACMAFYQLCKYKPDITNKIFKTEDNNETFMKKFNIPYKLLELCIFKKDGFDEYKRDDERREAIKFFQEMKENAKEGLDKLIETCSEIGVLTPLLTEPTYLINRDFNLYEEMLRRIVGRIRELLSTNKQAQIDFYKDGMLKKIIDLRKVYKKLKDELLAFDFYDQNMLNYFNEDYEKELWRKHELN